MASISIVTRKALKRLYPDADLEGFVPTHWVEVIDARTRKVMAEDAVVLGEPEGKVGVRYAICPGAREPRYAMVPPSRWQALDLHGIVRACPVKYVPDYVRPLDRQGYVYFVQSTGPARPIKIGWSQDVDRRLCELQTANAHALRVIGKIEGTLRDEAAMHARFGHLRMEAEWFQDAPEIHEFLEESGSAPIREHE